MPIERGGRVRNKLYQLFGAGRGVLGCPGSAFERLLIAPVIQGRLLHRVR